MLVFWRLWLPPPGERRYVPEGDLSAQYYPLRHYATTRMASGDLPLWNPYAFAGQPGLADIQSATLYPPQLVLSLASGGDLSYHSLQLQALVHLALAAAGTFLLGYRISSSRIGGAASAVTFSLSGYLTSSPVQQITILSTMAWFPWLLLGVDRLAQASTGTGRCLASLAVLFAACVLAGHPQTAALVIYALLGYGAWHLLRQDCRRPRRFLAFLGALLLGAGIAAMQVLPTLQFISLSSRASLGYEQVSAGFRPHELVAALYPGYFGGSPQYAGVLALMLAVAAVVWQPWIRTGFWVMLGLAGLLLSLGRDTALYPLAYLLLPGFGLSRNQERAIGLFAFAAAILAGLGLASLRRGSLGSSPWARTCERRATQAFAGAVAFAFVLLAGTRLPAAPGTQVNLFGGILKQHLWVLVSAGTAALLFRWHRQGQIAPPVLQSVLVLVLAVNLASVNWLYNLGPAPPAVAREGAEIVSFLKERLTPGFRIASGGLLPEGANAGLLYALPDITGNTPLRLRSLAEFENAVPEWRRWELLSVAYVLLPADVAPGPGLIEARAGDPAVYRLASPSPPVRLLHQAITVARKAVWEQLASPQFEPASECLIPIGDEPRLAPATGPESAHVESWEPERVMVQAAVSARAMAVFSLVAHPGWRVTVDEKPSRWFTCDGILIGVPLEAGTHTIELEYRPPVLYAGATISALSLAVTLFLAIAPTRRSDR